MDWPGVTPSIPPCAKSFFRYYCSRYVGLPILWLKIQNSVRNGARNDRHYKLLSRNKFMYSQRWYLRCLIICFAGQSGEAIHLTQFWMLLKILLLVSNHMFPGTSSSSRNHHGSQEPTQISGSHISQNFQPWRRVFKVRYFLLCFIPNPQNVWAYDWCWAGRAICWRVDEICSPNLRKDAKWHLTIVFYLHVFSNGYGYHCSEGKGWLSWLCLGAKSTTRVRT